MENVGLNDSAPAEKATSWTWFGRRTPGRHAARPAAVPAPPPADPHVPTGPAALITIDALGRKCPIPIIMLSEQIRDVPIGSVMADDPAAYSDIPAWCEMKSHSLAFREAYQTGWSFGIRRNY
jgi:tRNA 2-thiouridine synthesizing protein A